MLSTTRAGSQPRKGRSVVLRGRGPTGGRILTDRASYFFTLTSFQPLYGRLSDIFGRKECLLFSYCVFAVGCLGCGLATDMLQLCVARAVAGIGGGGMNSVVSILLTDIVPLRERGVWQGYLNIIFASGTSTGAPLGGLLADSVGWRWLVVGRAPPAVPFPLNLSVPL